MENFASENLDLIDSIKSDMSGMIKVMKLDKHKAIVLTAYDVKWYRNFREVEGWNDLMTLAKDKGLSVEYCRVGEDYDDYEYIVQNTEKPYFSLVPKTLYEIHSRIE
jgi:hypothetical protein